MQDIQSIKYISVSKIIKKNRILFPADVANIIVYFNNNNIMLEFISPDNIDVTSQFITKQIDKNIPLYDIIASEFEKNTKISALDKNKIYIHPAKYKTSLKPFINEKIIKNIIKEDTLNNIDNVVGRSVIWNMKVGQFVDYSISTILSICHYANVSPFLILDPSYSKQLMNITMNEFAMKTKLTKEEKDVLNKIILTYFPSQNQQQV